MGKICIRAIPKNFNNGWLLLPATNQDKRVLNMFSEENSGKYVTVTVNLQKGDKTYDQVKTVWALISILFEAQNNRQPQVFESEIMYNSLILEYAERITDPRHPEQSVPITLSQMSIEQAARFIQNIELEVIMSIDESHCEWDDKLKCDVNEIFTMFEDYKGGCKNDPTDYGPDGQLLSTAEWVKTHNVSMASGSRENLEIAHIVSKGTAPQYRDCCWNFLRLTHYEHIEIQHGKDGWTTLLKIYPWLRKRVRRARELAHQLDTLNLNDNEKKN